MDRRIQDARQAAMNMTFESGAAFYAINAGSANLRPNLVKPDRSRQSTRWQAKKVTEVTTTVDLPMSNKGCSFCGHAISGFGSAKRRLLVLCFHDRIAVFSKRWCKSKVPPPTNRLQTSLLALCRIVGWAMSAKQRAHHHLDSSRTQRESERRQKKKNKKKKSKRNTSF